MLSSGITAIIIGLMLVIYMCLEIDSMKKVNNDVKSFVRVVLVIAISITTYFFAEKRVVNQIGVGIKKVEIEINENGCETYVLKENEDVELMTTPLCK